MKETVKEPCCDKCGQSLPQPPPLTTSEKITQAKKLLKESRAYLGLKSEPIFELLIDILGDLEQRPTVTFPPIQTFPTLPPNGTVPWNPPLPTPYFGDPLPGRWPTTTCQSTGEKTTHPVALSQADGFVAPASDSFRHD